jgi:hypothetical protein
MEAACIWTNSNGSNMRRRGLRTNAIPCCIQNRLGRAARQPEPLQKRGERVGRRRHRAIFLRRHVEGLFPAPAGRRGSTSRRRAPGTARRYRSTCWPPPRPPGSPPAHRSSARWCPRRAHCTSLSCITKSLPRKITVVGMGSQAGALGLNEQMFGAEQQVPGQDQSYKPQRQCDFRRAKDRSISSE